MPAGATEAEDAIEDFLEAAGTVNAHLIFNGPFICGEKIGIADINLGVQLSRLVVHAEVWHHINIEDDCPAIGVYLERLRKRAAWKNSALDVLAGLLYSIHKVEEKKSSRLTKKGLAMLRAEAEKKRNAKGHANFCL